MAVKEQLLLNKQILSLLGEVVATNVSLEDYMENYAADFCEWVEGVVIKMSGTVTHNEPSY